MAEMPLPWQPLSLSPGETWRAGLALLPALTHFLATLTLSQAQCQVLLAIAVVLGVLSVPVAFLQVLGGEESPLYFFIYQPRLGGRFLCQRQSLRRVLLHADPARGSVGERAREAPHGAALGHFRRRRIRLPARPCIVALAQRLGVRNLSVLATFALILRDPLRRALTCRARWVVAIVAAGAVLPIVLAMGLLAILSRFEVQQVAADAPWTMAGRHLAGASIVFPDRLRAWHLRARVPTA